VVGSADRAFDARQNSDGASHHRPVERAHGSDSGQWPGSQTVHPTRFR